MYLVVISYCEEETYFFQTKKQMLKFFDSKSIKELLKKENRLFSSATVYKIEKFFK